MELELKKDKEIEELCPPIDPATCESLKADIKRRGIQVKLVVSEDGIIVCGNNRFDLANELIEEGIDIKIPYDVKAFSCRMEMIEYATKDNILRRQMNLYQKCMLIEGIEKYAKNIMQSRMKVAGSKGGKIGGKIAGRGRPKDK